ncbi:hypothetical protein PAXRUDRAFT_165575, partial [Paxillus rubicundulus Ve08.2h10]
RDPCELVCSVLENPNFANNMDIQPYCEFETATDQHQFINFMSTDWAWNQAVNIIAKDPSIHGPMFMPFILGSDKTTVSVATGPNDFYPLYLSVSNIHSNIWHAQNHEGTCFNCSIHLFKHQLFHTSLSGILSSLKPGMTKPKVIQFDDGHFHHVVYGLGPYIADYKGQTLIACIVCLSLRHNLNANSLRHCWEHLEALAKEF